MLDNLSLTNKDMNFSHSEELSFMPSYVPKNSSPTKRPFLDIQRSAKIREVSAVKMCDAVFLITAEPTINLDSSLRNLSQQVSGQKVKIFLRIHPEKEVKAALLALKMKGIPEAETQEKKSPQAYDLSRLLSHTQVLKQGLKNGWRRILVLEDKAQPIKNAARLFQQAVSALPKAWDILYLARHQKNENITPDSKPIISATDKCVPYAYLISRKGMLKLHAALETIFAREFPIDDIRQTIRNYQRTGVLNAFIVKKPPLSFVFKDSIS